MTLLRRLWSYQRERFPLVAYLPTVVVFSGSAAAYARLTRQAPGFIPGERFAVGAFTALVFFVWLRILDEHKDADVDQPYRPELPVPRGLGSLTELRRVGGVLLGVALVLNMFVARICCLELGSGSCGRWAADTPRRERPGSNSSASCRTHVSEQSCPQDSM